MKTDLLWKWTDYQVIQGWAQTHLWGTWLIMYRTTWLYIPSQGLVPHPWEHNVQKQTHFIFPHIRSWKQTKHTPADWLHKCRLALGAGEFDIILTVTGIQTASKKLELQYMETWFSLCLLSLWCISIPRREGSHDFHRKLIDWSNVQGCAGTVAFYFPSHSCCEHKKTQHTITTISTGWILEFSEENLTTYGTYRNTDCQQEATCRTAILRGDIVQPLSNVSMMHINQGETAPMISITIWLNTNSKANRDNDTCFKVCRLFVLNPLTSNCCLPIGFVQERPSSCRQKAIVVFCFCCYLSIISSLDLYLIPIVQLGGGGGGWMNRSPPPWTIG